MTGYSEGKHDDPADTQDRLVKVGTKYQATAPAVADGDNVYLLVDAAGRILIAGSVAHDEADAGNPIKVGAKAETGVQAAVSDGDRVDLVATEFGALAVLNVDTSSNMANGARVLRPNSDAESAGVYALETKAALKAFAPDGAFDRLRTVGDAAPGLGVLAVGPRSPGASEVQGTVASTSGNSSTRATLLTPTTGKKVRIIAVTMVSASATGTNFEIYFGTGANIDTTPANVIAGQWLDLTDMPSANIPFPDGGGPVGAVDTVVSVRTSADITTNGRFILIYRDE